MSSEATAPSSAIRTRPVKRRRVAEASDDEESVPSSSQPRGVSSFLDDEAEESSTNESEVDLPPQLTESFEEAESSSPEAKPRYKYHVPKAASKAPEDTFVTQLTQRHSSPSRPRGPRWRKLKPEVEQSKKTSTVLSACQKVPPRQDFDDDEELTAAIAESLKTHHQLSRNSHAQVESFEEFAHPLLDQTLDKTLSPEPVAPASSRRAEDDSDDYGSDPFESLPEVDLLEEEVPLEQSRSRPLNTQTNLRQTTLFGTVQAQEPSTQRRNRTWPLANRDEPPTHHKLDREAAKTYVYPTNLGRIRDYQYNIVACGLYNNTLVALPTGLGKTFIAATIMLNWYRWTKDAQIVFVAPTKPLVSQQVGACFGIAGIPRSDTTLLTGNISPGLRAEEWQQKRVFFMTPQTLINDLKTGIADPKRLVLLVVDEAHRATGNYAYVEVVKFLRRFNQSFRVLALTATPGSTIESVQAVIDGLEISRVEIRTEQSLDIRGYVHDRNVDIELFDNTEEMDMIMDLYSKALQPLLTRLNGQNAFWGKDPLALTAYGLTKARQQWMGTAGQNANMGVKAMVNSLFTALSSLAHATELLKFHGLGPFYRKALELREGPIEGSGAKNKKEIANSEPFRKMMGRLDAWMKDPAFMGHPKLEYLSRVVLNHFMDAGDGAGAAQGRPPSDTRIMIFCHFRDSAEEVVRILKRHEPMIRPHVFVGQASAKGSEGMDQKKQLNIVEDFKKGTYNTIVATSIGEEGLDIGEVDLIVCYDSSASPIRMLQRMGRTGRKRAGQIVLLLMRGKEEESYKKAKHNYEHMQGTIANGDKFNFHFDMSTRILPRDIEPIPDRRQVEIPHENTQADLPEPKKKKGRAPKRPPKKFHMPDGVDTNFTTAGSLVGSSKRKRIAVVRTPTPSPEPAEIPNPESCFLTAKQELELERNFLDIPGTEAEYVRAPSLGAFPELQRTLRPTHMVPHSTRTKRFVHMMSSIQLFKPDYDIEEHYRQNLCMEDLQDPDVTPRKSSARAVPPKKRPRSPSPLPSLLDSSPEPLTPRPPPDTQVTEDNGSPIRMSQLLKGSDDHNLPDPLPQPDIPMSSLESELPDMQLLTSASKKSWSTPRRRNVLDDEDDSDDDDDLAMDFL